MIIGHKNAFMFDVPDLINEEELENYLNEKYQDKTCQVSYYREKQNKMKKAKDPSKNNTLLHLLEICN